MSKNEFSKKWKTHFGHTFWAMADLTYNGWFAATDNINTANLALITI